MEHKYFYVGLVDGYALESGRNVTRVRQRLMRYGEAKELKINVYKLCGKSMLPIATRYVKGGVKL